MTLKFDKLVNNFSKMLDRCSNGWEAAVAEATDGRMVGQTGQRSTCGLDRCGIMTCHVC